MGEYLRSKFVKIRKPHVCFGCGRKFEPPSKMLSEVYADRGTLESIYLCDICADIASKLRYDDEFGYGDFREEALKRSMEKQEYADGLRTD